MDATLKAARLLDLSSSFTHDELDTAYRRSAAKLARLPDRDREPVLRALNEARDTLRGTLGPRPGTGLVLRRARPIAPPPDVPQHVLDQQLAAATGAVHTVVTYHLGRLARLRQQRFAAGLLTAGLGGVGILLHSTIGRITVSTFDGSAEVYPYWRAYIAVLSAALAAIGVVLGVMGWLVRSREQFLRLQVEGIAESLSDRATMADLLDEIGAGDNWTRQEFRAAISQWILDQASKAAAQRPGRATRLRTLVLSPLQAIGLHAPRDVSEPLWVFARRLGPTDFATLVLPRAVQGQLIGEAVIADESGQERHGYQRRLFATL